LPKWTDNDTWGRNYWDWADPVQAENVTEFAARYMMDHQDQFPNWKNDVRNILGLFLNHTGVCPTSRGEVYSGAWAFPESCGCCGRSLWYGPMELAMAFAQYGVEARSDWAREIARRMIILATYDGHETGVSEDNIDGGFVVNADWFKIAHPMALKHILGTMAWAPGELGAAGENHILRSTAVVNSVEETGDCLRFSTFDAPAGTTTTLRLAGPPAAVAAGNAHLPSRTELKGNGYTLSTLPNGDCLLAVRHDGIRELSLFGVGGQPRAATGAADKKPLAAAIAKPLQDAGSSATCQFAGNRLRLVGKFGPDGGLADVYLDGVKQRWGIDSWNPKPRPAQLLYARNGLADGMHTLRIVAQGRGNPRSKGTKIDLGPLYSSAAKSTGGFGEGGGPTGAQRMVFGYSGREDLKDSQGNLWRPATEFVVRSGSGTDSVAATWWTTPVPGSIAGTPDPQLYRYGVHAPEFTVNVTVGPGSYRVRLKLAAIRGLDPQKNRLTVELNGRQVIDKLDVAAAAGGPNRAVDLTFDDVAPQNGVITLRLLGGDPARKLPGEAFLQALAVTPGTGRD
jgi:hypothetical protein